MENSQFGNAFYFDKEKASSINKEGQKLIKQMQSVMEQKDSKQEERIYSDMRKAFIEGHNVCRCVTDNTNEAEKCFEEWFKQFKKD